MTKNTLAESKAELDHTAESRQWGLTMEKGVGFNSFWSLISGICCFSYSLVDLL